MWQSKIKLGVHSIQAASLWLLPLLHRNTHTHTHSNQQQETTPSLNPPFKKKQHEIQAMAQKHNFWWCNSAHLGNKISKNAIFILLMKPFSWIRIFFSPLVGGFHLKCWGLIHSHCGFIPIFFSKRLRNFLIYADVDIILLCKWRDWSSINRNDVIYQDVFPFRLIFFLSRSYS